MSKRQSKFMVIAKMFEANANGQISNETVQQSLEMLNFKMSQKDVEKFLLTYPEIPSSEFLTFLQNVNALKKGSGGGGGKGAGRKTRLTTIEAAEERGVAPEDYEEYVDILHTIYAGLRRLKQITKNCTVSFALPVIKGASIPELENDA